MPDSIRPLQLIADNGLFILIWLIQIIIYPAFAAIDKHLFTSWHQRYTKQIIIFVIPLMLIQAALELFRLFSGSFDPLRLTLVTLVWGISLLLAVPCHISLHKYGQNMSTIRHLLQVNWIRTVIWTALFVESAVHWFGK